MLGELLRHIGKKPATILYPFEKTPIAPNYRGRILFNGPACIGCQMCVKDCPSSAIKIIKEAAANPAAEAGAEVKEVKKFRCEIDMGRCLFCAQCVDSCPKKALSSSPKFELAALSAKALLDIQR